MRDKYITRNILLSGGMQKETAIQLIKNAPLDPVKPIEFVLREHVKPRKPDQNSLLWAGPLKDISEQAWVEGKRFSAEVWHEHYKRLYLPETYIECITKDGYVKWAETPKGDRVLIGSTTQLTVRGFAEYLEKVHADGANMGVMFRTARAA